MGRAGTTNNMSDGGRRGRPVPLQAYLVGLVLVFVVATGAATVYERTAAADDARRGALRSAQFQAGLAARDIASDLALARSEATSTAANPAIAQVFSTAAGCTLSFSGTGLFASGHLDIIRTDGSIACSSLPAPTTGYASAPWLLQALAGPTFEAPVTDVRGGHAAVLTAAPIPGRGALVVFLDLDALGPGLEASLGGPQHLEFVVVTKDGRTALTRSVDPARWAGADLSRTAFGAVTRADRGDLDGNHGDLDGNHRDLDGVRRLYGQATVTGVGWEVFAGERRSTALSAASRVSNREMAITLGGLLVFFAVTFVISRRITTPIQKLSNAVRRATTGDRDSAIDVGGPTEIATLTQAVNSLIRAGERELEALSRLATVVESSPDAIIGLDLDGTITTWNSGAQVIFGYASDEVVGRDASILSGGAVRDPTADPTSIFATRGDPVPTFEVRLTRKDGTAIDAAITIAPIKGGAGEAIGASAVCRDITEIKRADLERRALEERLSQSQRLESLGQLAGGIAHDFNNLLGVILNYAGFVAEQIPGNDAAQIDLEQIQLAAERGARLTRQLLIVGRREAIAPQELDLTDVAADMHSLLSRSIGEHVVLVSEPAATLPLVRADRGQMEQVLLNLSLNARDAMPAGGTLTIKTQVRRLDDDYCRQHPEVTPGRFVELSVSDTGTGIAPEIASRIFEPFFTTKPRGEGTGLGLATLYGIVTSTGGSVNVISEVGVGTTFEVFLPALSFEGDATGRARTPEWSHMPGRR